MVSDYPQVDIFPHVAEYQPDKYPMAGMTSHKVTVGVYDLNTQTTIYLQAGDPTDRYFTNIAWSPDGKNIYMFELNRDQNDCRLVCYNATTGAKRGRVAERDQRQIRRTPASHTVSAMGRRPIHHAEPARRLQSLIPL